MYDVHCLRLCRNKINKDIAEDSPQWVHIAGEGWLCPYCTATVDISELENRIDRGLSDDEQQAILNNQDTE